ncbi:hypothetical protein [Streptomyces sp. NPDC058155]|uniref:hypothetical protein n=1 Tax=Streptomyces sp. NPDC058155 TaxID=3346359 RepID=UPI0036F0A4F2
MVGLAFVASVEAAAAGEQIIRARMMLDTPGTTVTATALAFGVSTRTIYRHVIGRARSR